MLRPIKNVTAVIECYRIAAISGWSLIIIGFVLNVWVVEQLFASDSDIEWPNTLFVYIFQLLLVCLGALFLLIQKNIGSIESYAIKAGEEKLALLIFLILLATNVLLQILYYLTMDSTIYVVNILHGWFHLDIEKNVPSTYSAFQLLLASLTALLCFKRQGQARGNPSTMRFVWLGVSLALFYIGLDEFFSFHENTGRLLVEWNIVELDDIKDFKEYGYAWTIIFGTVVVALGLPFTFCFFSIFSDCRYLFYLLVLSGSIFVLGAIGMENFQVYLKNGGANVDSTYFLMLEEFFEMLGVSLAIFVFLRFCAILDQENTDATQVPIDYRANKIHRSISPR